MTVLDHNPRPAARVGLVNPVWPSAPSSRGTSPAHDEGVHEAWAREVVSFVGDERGQVRAVLVDEVEIVRVDGRREFRPVPGSRHELPAELVLLAAGFVGTDVPELLDELGVQRRPGEARSTSTTAGRPRRPACTPAATRPAAPRWWSGRSPKAGRALPRWTMR